MQDYIDAILAIAHTESLQIASRVNHLALKRGHITLAYFQAAAAALAQLILNKD